MSVPPRPPVAIPLPRVVSLLSAVAVAATLTMFAPTPSEASTVAYNRDGVASDGPSISVDGDRVAGSFVVHTSKRIRFTYLQLAVRDAHGGNHDFAYNPGASVGRRREFTGSRDRTAPGRYTAWVAYSLDGRVWRRVGPTTDVTVGRPRSAEPSPTPPPASAVQPFSATGGRPFAPTSAWNVPIPADPVLDAGSAAVSRYLGTRRPGKQIAGVSTQDYAIPYYHADARTPRQTVTCTYSWGGCFRGEQVPIPAGAQPNAGSDGVMVIVDWSTGKVYETWQARRRADGSWHTSAGDVTSDVHNGDGRGSVVTGAGISRLAGVVRTYEIAQGRIDHALVFSTSNACRGTFRYPATKTDGGSAAADCIPQGTRIQLDPSVDVDAVPGMTSGERTIAKALQVYGAYAMDNTSGPNTGFQLEKPVGVSNPYPAAGFRWDYYELDKIPWHRLRVLRRWDGR